MSCEEYCRKCGCDVFECGGNVTGVCIRRPAPSPQPEMPEGWRRCADGQSTHYTSSGFARLDDGLLTAVDAPLSVLRALLATQGLHVICAKQKADAEETKQALIDMREALANIYMALQLRGTNIAKQIEPLLSKVGADGSIWDVGGEA